MARTRPSQRRRQRVLSDDEISAVWRAAEASPSAFGYLVQFLLLTATRRTEAAAMRRSEVVGKEWIIPQERYKTGLELVIPLSPAAQAVLAAVPKIGKSGFVFTTDGKRPLGGFSKFKRAFDTKVLAELRKENSDAELPRWTLHDLRRTARSLMSRAGVPSDHAERCLGHVCPVSVAPTIGMSISPRSVRRSKRWRALIARIVNPADNVVALSDGRAKSHPAPA